MRPAGRGELDSLYFTYPRFAPPAAPARPARVAIVGAGPVGLTAALALASHGIESVVLERKDTFNDGSRAICIARPSVHILDRVGAVGPFLAKALGWTDGRSFWRGREVFHLTMPHGPDERYLPMYNLQQQYIEQFLWQEAARQPLIELRWQSEVTAIAQDAAGVRLTVAGPGGSERIAADWVLAADGARSMLRGLLDLRLKGANHEGRYVIADVVMDHDHPTERRALFDPPSNPGGTVLIHRQPDNLWRIDYQLTEGVDAEAAVAEAEIRRRVGAILHDIGHAGPWQLEWWSVYTANTLCLDDYRHGRVLFIGDAAHIVPIFGVRGLNNGLADADNAAWKLAAVLRGEAGPGLVDSYTAERRGATLDVFANATRSTRFMTPPTGGWRLARAAALSLAVDHPFARPLADPRQMRPYTYGDSRLTTPDTDAFGAGPVPGALAGNVRLAEGGFLLDHAGRGFTLLVFGAPPRGGPFDALAGALRRRDRRLAVLPVTTDGSAGVADPDGRVARAYGAAPGAIYLLRPDLHVAGRWRNPVPEAVEAGMARALGFVP